MTLREQRSIEIGNVADAGAHTRGWFVGDLAAWATQRGETFDAASTLRQTDALQVKWSIHPAGDVRAVWAPPDEQLSLSLLVDGDMSFDFRAVADGAERSVRLSERGEYVLWHGPSYTHVWRTERGCAILTIRWPIRERVSG